MSLHLALARAPHARVTGSDYGMTLLRHPPLKVFSLAQIYFPPLAWQLVADDEYSLLLDQGWIDVSSWLAFTPKTEVALPDLLDSLPLVVHPRQDPQLSKYWSELFHDEHSFIVVSDNAVRSEWDD